LTVILDGKGDDLERVDVGMRAHLEVNKISIPDANIVWNLDRSLEWLPNEALEDTLAIGDCVGRLDSLRCTVLRIKGNGVEITGAASPWEQDSDRLGVALSQHLGAGEGLTPSGDDFVTGFLLAVNRYKASIWLKGDLEILNHQIVAEAYLKTTRLSANLIEMATWGESDERLLNAVDYVLGAEHALENVAADLSGWGHSSGIAGLAGLEVAIGNTLRS
jgi:hypothetical protein